MFRPDIHKLIKADTISRENSVQETVEDENVLFSAFSNNMEMNTLTHRVGAKKSNYYKLD